MTISIVIPTYNEEKIISQTIDQLYHYCQQNLSQYQWFIIIADNGSTDKTLEIVKNKKTKYPQIKYFHLEKRGKGGAIKHGWQTYPADIHIFMDADLPVELRFIDDLIQPIIKKSYDICIGSRHLKQSKLLWSFTRIFISRTYNFITKLFFNISLSDMHCGFKAISSNVVKFILPKIKNTGLFFDTELVILSQYSGFRIKEIPVSWIDTGRKTKIKIIQTAITYLKELIKLKWRLR
ncbi:glycosyltransferase [Patescibacteria group bacterium AH-259-L07]|nr:glycosyltransferase [Patescibacteria group bacterium AH-259-L07]